MAQRRDDMGGFGFPALQLRPALRPASPPRARLAPSSPYFRSPSPTRGPGLGASAASAGAAPSPMMLHLSRLLASLPLQSQGRARAALEELSSLRRAAALAQQKGAAVGSPQAGGGGFRSGTVCGDLKGLARVATGGHVTWPGAHRPDPATAAAAADRGDGGGGE